MIFIEPVKTVIEQLKGAAETVDKMRKIKPSPDCEECYRAITIAVQKTQELLDNPKVAINKDLPVASTSPNAKY